MPRSLISPTLTRLSIAIAAAVVACAAFVCHSAAAAVLLFNPHAEEITQIHHHLKRLIERLTVEPGELERSCKYESEIATAPPVNRIALTFDDGPVPVGTEHILNVLKKYGISATFFMDQDGRTYDVAMDNVYAVDYARQRQTNMTVRTGWRHAGAFFACYSPQSLIRITADCLPA